MTLFEMASHCSQGSYEAAAVELRRKGYLW